MNIAPLKHYAEPRFPTRRIIDEHPELLALVPKRWRRNPVVLAALTGVCLLLATAKSQADTKAKPSTVSRVAPIFQHGDGRGAFGCVAASPPVFLSEDEARAVIMDEAKKAGIHFAPDAETLPSVAVPSVSRYGFSEDSEEARRTGKRIENRRTHTEPLTLDGTDSRRKVSYEFVSQADFAEWERRERWRISTVSDFDILGAARVVRTGLEAAKPEGTVAVFYDPAAKQPSAKVLPPPYPYKGVPLTQQEIRENQEVWGNAAKALAREDLRKQVQDFIKWLKAQGVI